MKQLLLLFVLSLTLGTAFAQGVPCIPDPSFTETGVYPLPYDPVEFPEGGILDSACLNKPFKYVFTAVVGDTIIFQGNALLLDSLVLDPSASISGLPDGIGFACNPPNCKFEAGDIGCVALYGIVSDEAFLGDNELEINAMVYTPFFDFELSFPNPLFAPGTYSLYVHPEDYPNCFVSSDTEALEAVASIKNIPNPFSDYTTIEIGANERATLQFTVLDLLGKVIETRPVDVFPGINTLEFDGSQLPDGIYLYRFSDGAKVTTQKMVLSR